MHYYGQDEQWVRGLTFTQFRDRMRDVAEVTKLLQGEGQGRSVVDRDAYLAAMKRRGLSCPRTRK